MIHRKAAQNGRLFEFVIDNFYALVIIITIVAKYIGNRFNKGRSVNGEHFRKNRFNIIFRYSISVVIILISGIDGVLLINSIETVASISSV